MLKREANTRVCSKVFVVFLTVMVKHGYTGEFEIIDDHKAGKTVVNLTGRLNIPPTEKIKTKQQKKIKTFL